MTLITSRPSVPGYAGGLPQPAPLTTEGRLQRIEAMGQRVAGYVEFMSRVGSLNGSSGEAKDQAVAAFCERLAVLERELGRILEELQLG